MPDRNSLTHPSHHGRSQKSEVGSLTSAPLPRLFSSRNGVRPNQPTDSPAHLQTRGAETLSNLPHNVRGVETKNALQPERGRNESSNSPLNLDWGAATHLTSCIRVTAAETALHAVRAPSSDSHPQPFSLSALLTLPCFPNARQFGRSQPKVVLERQRCESPTAAVFRWWK